MGISPLRSVCLASRQSARLQALYAALDKKSGTYRKSPEQIAAAIALRKDEAHGVRSTLLKVLALHFIFTRAVSANMCDCSVKRLPVALAG